MNRSAIFPGVLLVLAAFQAISCAHQSTDRMLITGRFISESKEDLSAAYVTVYPSTVNIVCDSATVEPDGSFTIPISRKAVYRFYFVAPHRWVTTSLYIDRSFDLTVELKDDTLITPTLKFTDRNSLPARLYEVQKAAEKTIYNKNPDATPFDSLLAFEHDPVVREALAMGQLACILRAGGTPDRDTIKSRLERISPSHPYWAPFAFTLVEAAAHAHGQDYMDRAVELQEDSLVGGWLMLYYLPQGRMQGDSVRVRSYASRLVSQFPGTDFAKMARSFVSVSMQNLSVGCVLPAFSFPAVGQSDAQISSTELRDKTYLLVFWATWCGQCVKQMPFIREAYERYSSRGLEVLSVSFDDEPGKIETFLQSRTWIRWKQAYAPEGFNHEYVKSIGVFYVPTEILVDQHGTVLATSDNLRGTRLDSTLSRIWH